ncbi:aspartyl-phosphate phosphatase Spo0E family protein [Desulfoscipio sp. XC116]|uniref:aspartyl-phosphate phosphatase Spo0E family protein n=1 Tax=Desulfoscipio sp. XC116 TaxID=3144975 RepID=UPI00325AC20B
MSREEIVLEIVRLRAKMHDLVNVGADYAKLLKASQELDNYIVMYHRATEEMAYGV